MPPSVVDVYIGGLEFMSAVVTRCPEAVWDRPTPCAGWTALDVLGHVGSTTLFGIDLLDPIPPDRLRSPAIFSPERVLPPCATRTDAFVAWTGRDPEWRSSGTDG